LTRHEKIDDGKLSFEAFAKQDQVELTEKDIPALGGRADFKIENVGSLEELYGKIEMILRELT
jgi:dephospho-CoA kinase